MDVHPEPDGGATLRLSPVELAGYFNLLSEFLNRGNAWSDGTPIPPVATRPMRLQLHQLAIALGRNDIPPPDA